MNAVAAQATRPSRYRGPGMGADAGSSYSVSSFDLRAGLDVRVLAVTQVPADVLRELQRSRSAWHSGAGVEVAWRPL